MTNTEFFKLVMQYWAPSTVTFKLTEEGKMWLCRDKMFDPLFIGDSFDGIMNQLRQHFSELYLKQNTPK